MVHVIKSTAFVSKSQKREMGKNNICTDGYPINIDLKLKPVIMEKCPHYYQNNFEIILGIDPPTVRKIK